MSDPFIGEIKLVAWTNRIPTGWALCNGAQLSISQNQALYALIGVTYGGDGHTYFNLPNLQGRVPIADGTLTLDDNTHSIYSVGQKKAVEKVNVTGTTAVTLAAANLPGHTHPATFTPTGGGGGGAAQVNVTAAPGTTNVAAGNMLAKGTTGGGDDANTFAAPTSAVAGQLAGVSGGGGGITGGTVAVQTNNANPPTPAAGSVSMQVPILQPYLVMRYLIATQGLFPDSQ